MDFVVFADLCLEKMFTFKTGPYFPITAQFTERYPAMSGQVAGSQLHGADRINSWTRFSGIGITSKLFWVITA